MLRDCRACLCSGRLQEPAGFDIVKEKRAREEGERKRETGVGGGGITMPGPATHSPCDLAIKCGTPTSQPSPWTMQNLLHRRTGEDQEASGEWLLLQYFVQAKQVPSRGPGLLSALLKASPRHWRSNQLPNDRAVGAAAVVLVGFVGGSRPGSKLGMSVGEGVGRWGEE